MRAIEFIPEGIHKNTAMASGDPDEWFMSDHSESSKSVNDTLHKHYRGNSEIILEPLLVDILRKWIKFFQNSF